MRISLSSLALVVVLLVAPLAQAKEAPPAPGSAAALLAGDEWDRFCDRLKQAGRVVQAEGVPDTELERVEGYRYLLGMLAESIDVALYKTDLDDPQLRLAIDKFRGEAMPSSDARYIRAEIDGAGVYRLTGRLGNAAHIPLQAYGGKQAFETFDLRSVADADGSFSLTIGGPPLAENWMQVSRAAGMLQVREYFSDWDGAVFSEFVLERLDRVPRPAALTAEEMAAALQQATQAFEQRVPYWKQMMDQIRAGHDNSVSPARTLGDVGLGGLLYGSGWFDLEEDEAILIELDAPEASHWSFQLGNYWSQYLDFANFTSSTNGHQAKPSSDGKFRLVIARRDPGVPNWLDTAEHREGVIVYRYHDAKSSPVPKTKLVRLADLRGEMPADTPSVTPEERREEIERRWLHKARRWQP